MALPAPVVTAENRYFWTAGAEGCLRLKYCESCALFIHPPSPRCPTCLSDQIVIRDVSGRAKVATWTINHQAWHPELPPPYALAIVEMEEAPYVRLTTRIVNCDPGAVESAMSVQVVFEKQGDAWLPLFEPVAA